MLIYTTENIFNSPAQTLVNTVNIYGVMGKGIAKEFKEYYPEMYTKYRQICKEKKFDVGMLLLSKEEVVTYRGKRNKEIRRKWVLNFPTKKHWREKSKLSYIESGLQKFVDTFEEKKIESVSFPQLGVGNGKLNWDEVKPLMEKYLGNLPIPVYIHIYSKKDFFSENNQKNIKTNLNTKHDAWKTETLSSLLFEKEIIASRINCDGIVLPKEMFVENSIAIDYLKKFVKYRDFEVIDQKNGKTYNALKIEKEAIVKQMELF